MLEQPVLALFLHWGIWQACVCSTKVRGPLNQPGAKATSFPKPPMKLVPRTTKKNERSEHYSRVDFASSIMVQGEM